MVYAPQVEIHPDLVDRLIDLYCEWRAGRAEVREAYALFCTAPAADRAIAFAAYGAALDREQRACESYAAQVRLIQALCARARPRQTEWEQE